MSMCTGFDTGLLWSRRKMLSWFPGALGSMALAQLLRADGIDSVANHHTDRPRQLLENDDLSGGVLTVLHHPPRAKRVIFLFQSGGPSQHDLFDYKPELNRLHGQQLPDSIRQGQRLTGMSGNQTNIPLAGSPFKFQQHGQSGLWLSELLPYTAEVADELLMIKSLHTEAINHGPGTTFVQTGSQLPGRPSIGAWLSYGLGSRNRDLPAFVVLVTNKPADQPLQVRLWGSGFLPAKHEGVRFLAGDSPVLYLNNPAGLDRTARRNMLDALSELHARQLADFADPLIENRIAQYELGYRMQQAIPEVADLSDEPESTFELYGPDSRKPGTYAYNCIMARRLAQRNVQFIQLYHPGWDHHGGLPGGIRNLCKETDQPSAALVTDLKRHGLLDETLVVWAGEFGRTNYCQGKLTANDFGRDHHPRCFSIWMAGGGVKAGSSYGQTDDLGYNITENSVHIHDFQATLFHLLGIDHERLTFRHQGRRYRLTDVHGDVIQELLG